MKVLFTTLAIASVASVPYVSANSQWPNEEKVISVIVPFGAGGGTDSAFRPLVEELKKHLPARVQVVNIDGAASAQGTNELLNRSADGYSVLASGTHTIGVTMQGLTKGYDELEQIVGLNWDPFIIAVLKDSPYNSFTELVDFASNNPGKVCLGNAGMGGATGLASVGINLAFDNTFNVTPFNGGNAMRADVLGGRCQAGIFSQSEILSESRRLEPLVVLYHQRSHLDSLAHVPTLKEAGYQDLQVPGGSYKSISVRKDVPEDVKAVLTQAFATAAKSDNYVTFMQQNGIIEDFTISKESQQYFESLVDGFEPIVKAANLYKK